MAYNPDQLDLFADPVLDLFLKIEMELLASIASALQTDEEEINEDVTAWQFAKLMQMNSLNKANILIISQLSGVSEDMIEEMIDKAGFQHLKSNEEYYEQAKKEGAKLSKPAALGEDAAVRAVLLSGQLQAVKKMNAVAATMLQQAGRVYQDIISKTTAKAMLGHVTPHQALIQTCKEWGQHGIPVLVDKKGRRWSTEAYVRMNIRTTVQQVTNDMQDSRAQSWGADLVEVSSHSGARPKCSKDQGKVYSLSGNHPKYPHFSSTSYGEIDGLFGINCRHQKYPYFEGISVRRYKPVNQKDNKKEYEKSQDQRKLERDIRQAKKELAMVEHLGNEDAIKKAKSKISMRQAKMRSFISESDRTRHYDREQIY